MVTAPWTPPPDRGSSPDSVAGLLDVTLHLVARGTLLGGLGRALRLRLGLVGRCHDLRDPLAVLRGRVAPARLVPVDLLQLPALGERVDDLDRPRPDEARVRDPAGLVDLEQVAAQRLHVVADPLALRHRIQAPGQPRVLGGDAGRTATGVALLGLDATRPQHGPPAHIYPLHPHPPS